MTTYNKILKLFLIPIITVLLGAVMTGCADKEELASGAYGYAQFKLYKAASYQQSSEETPEAKSSRASNAEIEKLDDIQKIEVELMYNETSISQTLVLNSYSADNAEFGMRSDKLELLAGKYTIVGYKLLNKVDEVVTSISLSEEMEIRAGELTVKDLTADVSKRGMVQFRVIKDWIKTRASDKETYLFSNINLVDVTIQNTFTQATINLEKIPVKYQLDYEENPSTEIDDKYYSKETAIADSIVWVPAGNYRVIQYSTFRKSGSVTYNLEIGTKVEGAPFDVNDNEITKDVEVPVKLSETAENIKDYIALKEIWESLNGPEWNYIGEAFPAGCNWNFNKEIDMWGVQPGVGLDDKGRVTSLSLAGFGVSGVVPDAIGQLTELRILAFGTHDEKLGGKLPADLTSNMTDAKKKAIRENYSNMFLKHDSRENLSEMLQWVINRDPKQKPIQKFARISPKDVQVGNYTNNITAISKAVMRLTKLQNLFIANSPVHADNIFKDWAGKNTSYKELWEDEVETWDWSKFTDLTDMEIYNCSKIGRIPDFVLDLPELQVINLACNKLGIHDMRKEWNRLITGSQTESTGETKVASKIQMIYLGFNNIPEFPATESLAKMKNLHMLECVDCGIKKVNKFGEHVVLAQLTLDNNNIEEIPAGFCKFSNDVETLSFRNNKLKKIPNIFDGASNFVMGSVSFANNEITGVADPSEFKGINTGSLDLSNNKLEVFPKEIFHAQSPIATLNLAGNLIKEIKEGDITNGGLNKKAKLLTTIDLRFNKLSSLPVDFMATGIPYLKGFDVSYNCFSEVPPQPLNCSELEAIGVRHQRDEDGKRILRKWPVGITKCPSLLQLQIGSNDIRLVDEEMIPRLWIVEVKDNPNITMDVTSVCPYISAGMWLLIYDKSQDIRGCDALGIEK